MADSRSPTELPDFDKLWDFADPAKTERQFREILPAAEKANDDAYRLSLLAQIARAEGLQRKFDEAHRTLDEVEARLETAGPLPRVRYLLERGRVHNSSGKSDAARPLFLEAWDVAREAGLDNFAVDAAHMMGIIEPPDEALRWNDEALALAESSENERARLWLGSLYNNIGWTRHDRGEYETALALFQKALALREQQGQPEPIRVAKWCVARTLRSLGRLDEALAMQQALQREHDELGQSDGYVFEELGELYHIRGERDRAADYFARAHAELSKDPWLSENEPDHLARLKRLAEREP